MKSELKDLWKFFSQMRATGRNALFLPLEDYVSEMLISILLTTRIWANTEDQIEDEGKWGFVDSSNN